MHHDGLCTTENAAYQLLFSFHASGLEHYAVTGEQAVGQGTADCFLAESQIRDATSRDHQV